MKKMGHLAISASAGSGKTYQLALRFVALLNAGVSPDRIVALTFSRKAAGEIFDAIVERLCDSKSLDALRSLLAAMSRLRIGTLDSFAVGLVRAFPMELGLAPQFEVIDGDGPAAQLLRRDALARLLGGGTTKKDDQRQFLEAFKQATFGHEEKGLFRNLDEFITSYQKYYRLLSRMDGWGDEKTIWPKGSPWLAAKVDVKAVAAELENFVQKQGWPEKVKTRWLSFVADARAFGPEAPWSKPLDYLTVKLLAAEPETVKIEKTECRLDAGAARAARGLLAHVVGSEIRHALERTRGVFRLLDQFEGLYDPAMRRQGRLTFDDVQYLLTPANDVTLSRRDGAGRLNIDYRVDAQLDHWMLDEFQDTSDLQWDALRNLVDEVVQDNSGTRSFFCVGDIKQAIYGWRGGNAALMGRVLDQYRGRIKTQPLAESFRSCPAVIDLVNATFDPLPPEIPAAAAAAWQRAWTKHAVASGRKVKKGCAFVLEPDSQGGTEKPDFAARIHVAAQIVNELQPAKRDLSVAVLVRKNDNGAEAVDQLRRECPGVRIVHEGSISVADNPVVLTLLALVKFIAHPGDTYAWRHVQMSPLAKAGLDPEHAPGTLLAEIQANGFAAFLQSWGGRLGKLDAFGRQRLDDLVSVARAFDRQDDFSCDAFLEFVDGSKIREQAAQGCVRVMTVHQAKGLGFDAVILPDLQDGDLTGGGKVEFVLAREDDSGDPRWMLRMPRRLVAENDPALAEVVAQEDADSAFEELCVLYVALTRARHGLYVITSFAGAESKKYSAAAFLKKQVGGEANPVSGETVEIGGETFTCLRQSGDRNWYAEKAGAKPEARPASVFSARRGSGRLKRISPSRRAEKTRGGNMLFAEATRNSLELGLGVHELFERVEWDGAGVDRIIAEWEGSPAVAEHFRRAAGAKEIRAALARPGGDAALWREQRFEVVLGDEWVTGSFDRVVIEKDRATIIDFKTNEIREEGDLERAAADYAPQMKLYRRALGMLLGRAESKIDVKLIFTQPGKVIDV